VDGFEGLSVAAWLVDLRPLHVEHGSSNFLGGFGWDHGLWEDQSMVDANKDKSCK
jgi:hypothetical protein